MPLPLLLAKVVSAPLIAKLGAGVGIGLVAVTGAAASGTLPAPVQDRVADLVASVSPVHLPHAEHPAATDPAGRSDDATPTSTTSTTPSTSGLSTSGLGDAVPSTAPTSGPDGVEHPAGDDDATPESTHGAGHEADDDAGHETGHDTGTGADDDGGHQDRHGTGHTAAPPVVVAPVPTPAAPSSTSGRGGRDDSGRGGAPTTTSAPTAAPTAAPTSADDHGGHGGGHGGDDDPTG